jgi:hypothetical protein
MLSRCPSQPTERTYAALLPRARRQRPLIDAADDHGRSTELPGQETYLPLRHRLDVRLVTVLTLVDLVILPLLLAPGVALLPISQWAGRTYPPFSSGMSKARRLAPSAPGSLLVHSHGPPFELVDGQTKRRPGVRSPLSGTKVERLFVMVAWDLWFASSPINCCNQPAGPQSMGHAIQVLRAWAPLSRASSPLSAEGCSPVNVFHES